MNFKLKSYDVVPPNCFSYEQTQGIARSFHREPVIEAVAKAVSAFRKGNGLPRAGLRESLEDVDWYNATVVLRGDPRFTSPTSGPAVAVGDTAAILNEGCKGCGAPV